MEQITKLLEERKKQLLRVKKEKEKALSKAPKGALRVCCHGNRTQFYHRNDSKDLNGVYIRDKDIHVAQKLAQKDYDKKVLSAAENELMVIHKCLADYPKICAEDVYEGLHRERKKLILPILEPDEEYVHRWVNQEYQGKEFYGELPEFYTAKGERVRSKSEVIIADMLYREGIPYRYEYPIYLEGMGTIHPDFTVLNVRRRKEFYWEHLGMMDDELYAENAIEKIICYGQNDILPGVNLILTYETRKTPLNQKVIKRIFEYYLY